MEASELHLPPAYPSDQPASESQIFGLKRFYRGSAFDNLTDYQAGALLDYRDFAKAVVERLAPGLYQEKQRAPAEAIAIYISRRRRLAEAIVSVMRARFEAGDDPDELVNALPALECYEDIGAFAADLLDVEIEDDGADGEQETLQAIMQRRNREGAGGGGTQ